MQLEHSFSVPVGVDEAWRILTDVERISPCFPGTKLTSIEGDEFSGSVKIKLGPVNLTYKGTAAFLEKDESARRAVVEARGTDARGGTATASFTATLAEHGASTRVDVVTDLELTGKPAQFGRNVMEDVGNRLLGQFADCLAGTLKGEVDVETPIAAEAQAAAAVAEPTFSAPEALDPIENPPVTDAPADAPAVKRRPKPPARSDRPAEVPPADEPVAAPPSSDDERPPSAQEPALPAAAPLTSVNGHGSATGNRLREETVDLVERARPAIAKRLGPVAVALVMVLLAVRRRRK